METVYPTISFYLIIISLVALIIASILNFRKNNKLTVEAIKSSPYHSSRLEDAIKELEEKNELQHATAKIMADLQHEFKLLNETLANASLNATKQYKAISKTITKLTKQQQSHLTNLNSLKSLTLGDKND